MLVGTINDIVPCYWTLHGYRVEQSFGGGFSLEWRVSVGAANLNSYASFPSKPAVPSLTLRSYLGCTPGLGMRSRVLYSVLEFRAQIRVLPQVPNPQSPSLPDLSLQGSAPASTRL